MPYDLPRVPLPTGASSADLARLPSEFRRQALFSARLNRLEPVAEIGASLKGILDGGMSDSEARTNIRAVLAATGYRPPEGREGGLLDHTSRTRLDLILTQNVRAARGYGKWAADMDPDLLDVWPAQELVRVMARKAPRGDWKQRWQEAGGTLVEGRMVALKTSPVWASLSRFGQPFPPYDYGSGMGVRDVRRDEAERLGIIGPDDTLTPEPIPFPDMAAARMPDLAGMEALQASILKVFGEGASFAGGALRLAAPSTVRGAVGTPATLGLSDPAARAVAAPPASIPRAEAERMVDSGQAATRDPLGRVVRFTRKAVAHWSDKTPKEAADVETRMTRIREAFAAVREPQETWERKGRVFHLKTFVDADGRTRRMLVISKDGVAETWIPNDARTRRAYVSQRKGTLQTLEGA